MSRPLAVLRPEPGASATAARIEALGARAIRLPLFAVHALAWEAPDPAGFDALLLTSANAVRLGGAELQRLKDLPVLAIGTATAAEAERAGLEIARIGRNDAAALLDQAQGYTRMLHLAGRERTLEAGGPIAQVIPVYATEPLAVDAARLEGSVALIHSTRAGARLAEIARARDRIAVAAISAKALAAAGDGWAGRAAATEPSDTALIAAALRLAD